MAAAVGTIQQVSAPTEPRKYRYGVDAILTPANLVTVTRLLLSIPVLLLIAREGTGWIALIGWLIVSGTDWLDGYMARRDGVTRSGAFLDPLADKLLVFGGFTALAVQGRYAWLPVALVVARELGIQAYRLLAARRGISLPALQMGKVKAVAQFAAVGIAVAPFFEPWGWITTTSLWFAVALTLVSGLDILRHGWKETRADAV